MSEFINVLEVEKLPLNVVDSLVAIDADKNIRRTFITVDQEVDPDSTNPVSSKGVYDIIEVLGNDFGEAVTDLEEQIDALDGNIADIRSEISALNEATGVDVAKFVISGELGWDYLADLQFTTGDVMDFLSRMKNGQKCDLTVLLNGEMCVTPTTTVVEHGNVAIVLVLGVDIFSIYISSSTGEIIPEFLGAVPSDYITESDLNKKGYATTAYVEDVIGNINTVLDVINGEEV